MTNHALTPRQGTRSIMAKIAYELFTHPRLYPDWQSYAKKLGQNVDWRKSAQIWQNNIITSGKSFSNKGPLIKAVEAVKGTIGMRRGKQADDQLELEDAVGAE